MTNKDRFWLKVYIKDDKEQCWEWLKSVTGGYGQLTLHGKAYSAHRLAYELFYEKQPGKLFVCHTCDNKICCNPHHLFLGTNSDNQKDCVRKGRNNGGFKKGRGWIGSKNGRAKLTEETVAEIKQLLRSNVKSSIIYDIYPITHQQLCYIKNNKTWTHVK